MSLCSLLRSLSSASAKPLLASFDQLAFHLQAATAQLLDELVAIAQCLTGALNTLVHITQWRAGRLAVGLDGQGFQLRK